ncbi:hypothetical protein OSG_eHP27_00105 [environmental Halophage eHP-27]|nr:hypothetical protein OSG_eHP27_00105 [environmental Halophage eHP-27]
MSKRDRVSEIRMHNTPEPNFTVRPVGKETHIIWNVDWEQMEHPTPQMIHDVSGVQVKLAVLMNHIQDDEIDEKANEAFDAVSDLLDLMADKRTDNKHDKQDVLMGSLDALPEVEREVEER